MPVGDIAQQGFGGEIAGKKLSPSKKSARSKRRLSATNRLCHLPNTNV